MFYGFAFLGDISCLTFPTKDFSAGATEQAFKQTFLRVLPKLSVRMIGSNDRFDLNILR
ncbi:hypothetical protein ACU8KH_05403 [Lachancea thermotolerans]